MSQETHFPMISYIYCTRIRIEIEKKSNPIRGNNKNLEKAIKNISCSDLGNQCIVCEVLMFSVIFFSNSIFNSVGIGHTKCE